MTPHTCPTCGTAFIDYTQQRQQRYCTPRCARLAWQRAHGIRPMSDARRCRTCGVPFTPQSRQQAYCCTHHVSARYNLPTTPGIVVGHCGRWHAITTLPTTVPCCGAVVGEEATPCP